MGYKQLDEAAIFNAARKIAEPESRAGYLKQACGEDPALLERVGSLLRVHDEEKSFLESPPSFFGGTAHTSTIHEGPGTVIGPYKLHEQIGEGGFGVVYLAEQQKPVRRRVALKIIKPGMDSKEVIARFEAERQALALMDHANIARVLDAGATESGRPYFVMELVKGIPITDYCNQCNLPTRERLELFVSVCQAIQHAHTKGIIHRDVKPTNVMMAMQNGSAEPKVIDFGVAKAINQRLTEHTLYTQFGQMVGTPMYMSPEQAEMSPMEVDTRSDIYSLGVLLYELLVGVTPFDSQRLSEASYDELRRIIREEEPPKPSTRLNTLGDLASRVAEHRRTDPHRLKQLVRGDLDWIVMKALEKDRRRRYETANGLAQDIERYLSSEPIAARPPTPGYRLGKLIIRNKLPFSFIAVLSIALSAFAVTAYMQAVRIQQERDAAMRQAAQAKLANAFLRSVLEYADPTIVGRDLTMREMLDRAESRVVEELGDEPTVEASVRQAIGHAYSAMSRFDDAEKQFRLAWEALRTLHGDVHPEVTAVIIDLANLWRHTQRYAEAEAMLRDAVERYRVALGEDHVEVAALLDALGRILHAKGESQAAEPLLREVLAIRRNQLGENHPHVAATLEALGHVVWVTEGLTASIALRREALEMLRSFYGDSHSAVTDSMYHLTFPYIFRGAPDDLEQAESLLTERLALVRQMFGPDNREVAVTLGGLAIVYVKQGRKAEAESLFKEALAMKRRVLGNEHYEVATGLMNLADFYSSQGRLELAEPLYHEALPISRNLLGAEHRETVRCLRGLARALLGTDHHAEAASLFRELLAIQRSTLEDEDPRLAKTLLDLGCSLLALGSFGDAESVLIECAGRYEEMSSHGTAPEVPFAAAHEIRPAPPTAETVHNETPNTHDSLVAPQRKTIERLIELYETWDAAEPGRGFSEKAAEWRARLEQWQGATEPAENGDR